MTTVFVLGWLAGVVCGLLIPATPAVYRRIRKRQYEQAYEQAVSTAPSPFPPPSQGQAYVSALNLRIRRRRRWR